MLDSFQEVLQIHESSLTGFTLFQNVLYTGDPQLPQIGDVRIWFEHVPYQEVSIMGKQTGNTIVVSRPPNKLPFGRLGTPDETLASLLASESPRSSFVTWILRWFCVGSLLV